ncbi:MAG: insulinase family protein [Planctomycetota bacterium]|nr:insulinase family protein [Planctomycetota bacterium]
MTMRRGVMLVLGASCVLAGVSRGQPLPADPSLVTGALPNGLTYIVKPHATPEKRAAVWMHVSTGSLNETDEQRGLAHFLEHMAFNGSANFPPGAVVPYFESLGLTFGRHQNAFTSFDQTTYQLSLPDNQPETLAKGLSFFADVNSRLLLSEAEIDQERGVILNEKTSRKSAMQRVSEAMLLRTAPGSRYAQRLPIGVDETLHSVKRQNFVDYYTAWYGPANTTVIVVADMDPHAAVEKITEAFDTPGAAPTPRPVDLDPGVTPYDASFGVVITDPELPRATVSMTRLEPLREPVTTIPDFRQDLVEDLAQRAFNTRLRNLVSDGAASFRGGFAGVSQSGRIIRSVQASVNGAPERWRDMLTDLLAEVQRARLHGFSLREIELARRDVLSTFERQASQEGTIPASGHLARINARLASGDTIMAASQELALARDLLPSITPEECSAWFARTFEPDAVMFAAQMPAGPHAPTEEDLLAAGIVAAAQTPDARHEAAAATSLMSALPQPGEVVASETHDATGVWSGWLSNNVRVHHKYMEERKGQVSVQVTLFGGELYETPETRGNTNAAGLAIGGGGTGVGGGGLPAAKSLSSTQIRELMTGRKVTVRGRVGPDAIQVSVAGDPADLEHAMQLAHLLLTEPRVEPAAFDRWREMMLQFVDTMPRNPLQMFSRTETEARYPEHEVRTKAFTREQIEGVTIEEAQATIDRLIAESPIEVAIVGEVSRERAIELASRYLGSLPQRPRVSAGQFADLRTLPAPDGPKVARVQVDTVTPAAGASVGFYAPDSANVDDVRAMQLAASVLSIRMNTKIREQQRLVYGIRCGVQPGNAYPGYGMVRAGAPCDPANAEALATSIAEVYEAFAQSGPTDEEVAIVKRQTANNLAEAMKDPAFWLGKLEAATADGIPLDDILAAPDAFQAITPAQILEVFNRYYSPQRTVTVVVTPRGAQATPAEPKASDAPKPAGI